MIFICNGCKKIFSPSCQVRSYLRKKKRIVIYCSRYCYHKNRKPKPICKPYFVKSSGYFMIRVNGKKIPYHRYLMQNKIGRKLNKKEVVHHINGIKNDNRLENLIVMSMSDHISLHETEERVKLKCKLCNKTIFRTKYLFNRRNNHFCDRRCTAIYIKKHPHHKRNNKTGRFTPKRRQI